MTEQKLTELMHQEIDSVNTPEESKILQRLIAESPEAERTYEELCSLSSTLSRVEQVDPPVTLKPAISRAIDQRQAPATAPSRKLRILEAIDQLTSGRKIAYAFSAGVLAGVALLLAGGNLVGLSGLDRNDVAGTLGAGEPSMLVGTSEVVTVPLEDLQGVIRAEYSGRLRILTMELTSATPVEIRVAYDREALFLEGVKPIGKANLDVTHTDTGLEVRGEGQIGVEVYLTANQEPVAPVGIAIASTDGRVYRGQIFLQR
ncbi:MAG: hypothetical protein WBG01_18480 [Bacteroidota bacterium]